MQEICRNKSCRSIFDVCFLTIWNFLISKQKHKSLQFVDQGEPTLYFLSLPKSHSLNSRIPNPIEITNHYILHMVYIKVHVFCLGLCHFLLSLLEKFNCPLASNLFVSGPQESLIILKLCIKTHIELCISRLYIFLQLPTFQNMQSKYQDIQSQTEKPST